MVSFIIDPEKQKKGDAKMKNIKKGINLMIKGRNDLNFFDWGEPVRRPALYSPWWGMGRKDHFAAN